MTTTTITKSQLQAANSAFLSSGGNPAAVWSVLSGAGDQYATAAYTGLTDDESFFHDVIFYSNRLSGVTNDKYQKITVNNVKGYLDLLNTQEANSDGSINLPNTTQIETNYYNSVINAGAPPSAAIDLSVAKLDKDGLNLGLSWYHDGPTGFGVQLDPARDGPPSNVIANISDVAAEIHFLETGLLATIKYGEDKAADTFSAIANNLESISLLANASDIVAAVGEHGVDITPSGVSFERPRGGLVALDLSENSITLSLNDGVETNFYSNQGFLRQSTYSFDDNSSGVTYFRTDGSNVTKYFTGPSETGALSGIDVEQANGMSIITTIDSSGNSYKTVYSGSEGSGDIIRQVNNIVAPVSETPPGAIASGNPTLPSNISSVVVPISSEPPTSSVQTPTPIAPILPSGSTPPSVPSVSNDPAPKTIGSSITTNPSWFETVTTDYSGPNGTGNVLSTTKTDINSATFNYRSSILTGTAKYDPVNGNVGNVNFQGGGASYQDTGGVLDVDYKTGNVTGWGIAAYNYQTPSDYTSDIGTSKNFNQDFSGKTHDYVQNEIDPQHPIIENDDDAHGVWSLVSTSELSQSTTQVDQDDFSLDIVPNDTISENGSADTFVFSASPGSSLITNFAATGSGHDVLSLPSSDFSSLAQVLAGATTNSNGDAVLNFTPSGSLTLSNVSLATLKAHPEDFVFHA